MRAGDSSVSAATHPIPWRVSKALTSAACHESWRNSIAHRTVLGICRKKASSRSSSRRKFGGQLKQHGAKTLVLDEWHQTRQHSLHIGDSIGPQPVHVGNLADAPSANRENRPVFGPAMCEPSALSATDTKCHPTQQCYTDQHSKTENQWILASLGKIVLRPARACMNNRRGRYECGSSSDTLKEIQCGAVNACRSRPFNKYMLGRRCIPGDQP